MNRKHYVAIARMIDEINTFSCGYDIKFVLIDKLVAYFKEENERFDAERFRAACATGTRGK